jgi:hypothetical protein
MTKWIIPIVNVLSILHLSFACNISAKATHTPHYTSQMKYFVKTMKIIEVIILSDQNAIPCGNPSIGSRYYLVIVSRLCIEYSLYEKSPDRRFIKRSLVLDHLCDMDSLMLNPLGEIVVYRSGTPMLPWPRHRMCWLSDTRRIMSLSIRWLLAVDPVPCPGCHAFYHKPKNREENLIGWMERQVFPSNPLLWIIFADAIHNSRIFLIPVEFSTRGNR